jgi:hypothetical protein
MNILVTYGGYVFEIPAERKAQWDRWCATAVDHDPPPWSRLLGRPTETDPPEQIIRRVAALLDRLPPDYDWKVAIDEQRGSAP